MPPLGKASILLHKKIVGLIKRKKRRAKVENLTIHEKRNCRKSPPSRE